MSAKADRLARALLSLRASYSDADFQGANDLLQSNDFLASVYAAIESATALPTPRRARSKRIAEPNTSAGRDTILDRLKQRSADVEGLPPFVGQYLDREVIADGAANRAFAEYLGLRLPKKLPSRMHLLDQYVKILASMDVGERHRALERAAQLSRHESSLQLWSDVINRRVD